MTVPAAHPTASIQKPQFKPPMLSSVQVASAPCKRCDASACAEAAGRPGASRRGSVEKPSAQWGEELSDAKKHSAEATTCTCICKH